MRVKRLLCSILAIAMVLSTMGITSLAAGPTADDDVALLAGLDVYVKDLQSAFTAEVNPDMKQVLMAKNWTGDIEINYPDFYSSFYLNGYTLEGQLKLTDLSTLTFYGIEPGNDWAGTDSKIVAPDYTIYQTSGANLNISGAMTIEATNEDGVAIYAENGKVVLTNKDTVVKGKVVSTGTAIVKISAGTYMGGFEADGATNLEITGGTFAADPSAYLPSGFTAIQGDDDMYTIQKPAASLDDLAKDADGKYIISTPEDVVTLREVMSKQSIVEGTEFVLANNIDMTGYTLASAGTDSNRFYGVFDGNDCTISNVTIEGGEDSYVAFFGNVSGATIKDLTLENVKVTGGQYTAGIVGRARSSTVTNCKVIGNIEIEGHDGVGAIVGGGVANVTGCEVSGNDGSYIKGQWDVAGISGLVSAGTTTVEGNSVAGVSITAIDGYAGGIAGRVLANDTKTGNNISISANEVEAVVITSGGKYSSGLILGSTVTSDISTVNYTDNAVSGSGLTVDGVTSNELYAGTADSDNIVVPVAKIGTEYYNTLKEAVAEITDNTTITIIAEVNNETIKLPAVLNNFVIDGNGMTIKDTTINAADGNSINYQGFTVKNTIFDNSRFVLGGMRNGDVIYKDLVFDNNKFINIVNTASMAAVHMNLASEDNEYIENFTFTNNVIDGVTGSNNSGVLLKSITGDVVFEGNTVSNVAWNAVQIATAKDDANLVIKSNSFTSSGSSVLNIAAAPSAILENNTVVNDSGRIGLWYPAEAKIGDVLYIDIQTAINNAEDGDTITILAGEYDAFTVPADKNNLTFIGETDADGNNLVTIRTLEDDIETQTKGIYVQAEKATFKNINIVSGDTLVKWLCSALGATNNSVGLGHSNLNELVVENCNFKGDGSKYAIWTRACDVTLINSTIDGYTYGVESYNLGADQEITIIGTEMSNVYNAIHTSNTVAGSLVAVEDSVISAQILHSSGEGRMTIKNSVLNNVDVMTYKTLALEITESELYDSAVGTYDGNSSIVLDKIYANNVNELAAAASAENITFSTYYPTYEDFENKTNLTDVPQISDAIFVKFEKASEAEGEIVYNINLVATDDKIINRLNSADLTFALNQVNGNNEYEIIASNDEVAINAVDNSKVRYEFHYNGKDGVKTDCGTKITIGQVKFTGYGEFSFAVDTNATTNTAHATTVADNIVDTFIPDGDTMVIASGELVIDSATTGNVVIAVPDRNLTINIDFPNAVEDQVIAYQDMKVVISGGDLAEDITIDLGNDAVANDDLGIFGKVDAKYVAEFVNGSYVINVTDALTLNNAYTVTISGAGYRTARYTVTMTDDKQLNFWNNVMDEAQVVEIGKDSSVAKVTFLAGDIVKDNNINIYDLSAVVSYFGTENLVEDYPDYAKYDLNRDGVIDSKDVAYVLVSWNN